MICFINTRIAYADMIKMTMTQPPPLNLASPAVTPASPQHLEQIAAARKRGKTIMRCASIANGSAWTIALFGALTAVTSIGSIVGMGLGIGMCFLAHFEFKGAKEIRRLDVSAVAPGAKPVDPGCRLC